MNSISGDFTYRLGIGHVYWLIDRKAYLFPTFYRWGRPVENELVDIDEPWSTHWTSAVFDVGVEDSFNLNTHLFHILEPPERTPYDHIAIPHEDFRGIWKCPRLGSRLYFVAKVTVVSTRETVKCWFELTDEEEERLWDRHMYNYIAHNASRYVR